MRIKNVILTLLVVLVLVACKDTETTVISAGTGVTSFYLYSPFNTSVKSNYFTIDTVNHLIYNEDSLEFGARLDSLAPIMYPTFAKAVMENGTNLYDADTVYVNFTNPRYMTVTSSTGETATYKITVVVHQVDPDSFIWRKTCDLGSGVIERQGAAMTSDGKMYWLMSRSGVLEMFSSMDGVSWTIESVENLPLYVDVEHLKIYGDKPCVMKGNEIYTYTGLSWSKTQTTSSVTLKHLLMSFNGKLYALGKGNVIMRLEGKSWKTSAQMGSGFPVSGESAFVCQSVTGLEKAYVMFGVDDQGNYLRDVWSSEDGDYWVKLTEKANSISLRSGAMACRYGKGILTLGGGNADSLVSDRFLFSKDYGVTWEGCDTLYHIDTANVQSYCIRSGGSVMVNSSGYVFVIGGRDSSGVVLGDVWRGLRYALIPGFKE